MDLLDFNGDIDEYLALIDKNFKAMQERDKEAKEKGTLIGRYISEPFADGSAYYEIIKVNKKTVKIRVIKEIGDDWVIPYWGEEASIDIEYAKNSVEGRDAW